MVAELVAVTPYGPGGASARVRVFDWLARIRRVPTDVYAYAGAASASPAALAPRYRQVLSAERQLRHLLADPPRRLLLHREASPFSRGRLESRLAKAADVSVYDFDDALQWDVPRSLPTWIFPKPTKCRAAVSTVDRVIAGNDTLADWAAGLARDVLVIPSCIEPASYELKPDYDLSDPPRLVWLGSPFTEQYLLSVAPALVALHERYGVRVTVISGRPRELPGLNHLIDRVTWSESDYVSQLMRADIALAPLTDTSYARGKCAYKVLQYGATGLPFVASPVGTNDIATKRLGGMAASSNDDWFGAVESLLMSSAETRKAFGRTGRSAVERHYSFEAWHDTWTEAVFGTADLNELGGFAQPT